MTREWLGSAGVKSCGHGSGWGSAAVKWLGRSGGQVMWTRESLGVSGRQVAGGQRGSNHVDTEWLGVSGGQVPESSCP